MFTTLGVRTALGTSVGVGRRHSPGTAGPSEGLGSGAILGSDLVQTHQGHQQILLRAVRPGNGKSFLSKIMQNTLEGNCEALRIRETHFDDF